MFKLAEGVSIAFTKFWNVRLKMDSQSDGTVYKIYLSPKKVPTQSRWMSTSDQ